MALRQWALTGVLMMIRKFVPVAGVVALVAALVVFNSAAGAALRGARVDFTEEKLYTLSPGIVPYLQTLPPPRAPVEMTLYFTRDAVGDQPGLLAYARRVEVILEE